MTIENSKIVFLEWSHVSSLHILKIKPLSEECFPIWLVLFHFNAVFFSHAEAFYFDESHLFILSFTSLSLEEISVKILLQGISEIFPLMFSSRTFTVSQLIFKSFIHLEFISVYGVSWWSSVIFFVCVAVKISQHHLLKRLFLLYFMLLPSLSNINWP